MIDHAPIGYVTFDRATRALTGAFYQVPPAEHTDRIAVAESIRLNWCAYRANEARDGVELAPVVPPEELPPQVPQQVTMRQARLALLDAGLLSQVDAAIESLASPAKETARIEWDYSSSVERGRPLVNMIGAALGLDEAGLDQLFIVAAGK